MFTKLDVFDFDKTLINTPTQTSENLKKYEKKTGLPWIIDKKLARELTIKTKKFVGMRGGWFGRHETLEPPLVPDPTPLALLNQDVFQTWNKSKNNPETITRLITGRHKGLKNYVLRICGDLDVLEVDYKQAKDHSKIKPYKDRTYSLKDTQAKLYLLGDDGPCEKGPIGSPDMPRKNIEWKIWIVRQYIEAYNLDTIEIWEDREEHAAIWENQNGLWAANFVVNLVK